MKKGKKLFFSTFLLSFVIGLSSCGGSVSESEAEYAGLDSAAMMAKSLSVAEDLGSNYNNDGKRVTLVGYISAKQGTAVVRNGKIKLKLMSDVENGTCLANDVSLNFGNKSNALSVQGKTINEYTTIWDNDMNRLRINDMIMITGTVVYTNKTAAERPQHISEDKWEKMQKTKNPYAFDMEKVIINKVN